MKNCFSFAAVIAALPFLFACGEGNASTDGPTEPFVLSVDKASIEADGIDKASFTIKDANGLDLTSGNYLKDVSLHVIETDTYLKRKENWFTSIDNGTYTIEGMYLGKACTAPVTVQAVNRSKYETFSKKVAFYRFTATWCGYCPQMTTALGKLDNFTKDHMVILAFHGDSDFGAVDGKNYISDIMISEYGLSGYPSCVYSLSVGSDKRTRNDIMDAVYDELKNHPAATGIKASTKIEDGKLSIEAAVKASKDGIYDLGCFILQDGLRASGANEDVYNNVVSAYTGNYRSISKDAWNLKAGEEKTGLGWTFDFNQANAGSCRIALFTLVKDGSKARIDNIIELPVGSSADYVYNK